jgi:hypothetical protein
MPGFPSQSFQTLVANWQAGDQKALEASITSSTVWPAITFAESVPTTLCKPQP